MSSKDSVSSKALRSGTWYTVSNFLLKGVGFITTPIFTRLMSKGEYGEYANYTAWLSIVAIIVTLEMSGCVYRARYDFEDDFDAFLSSITACGTAITAAFYLVVNIFMPFFERILDMDRVYIHIMFLTVLISPALSILQAKHRILQKYKSFVALSIGTTLVSTIASLICVYSMKDRLFGRIVGMTVPLMVVYLIAYIILMARGRAVFRAEYWKYAIAISLPLVPHLLSNTILGSSDRIMIKQLRSAEDAAVYSVAYSCGMIISILFTSLNQAWEPWLFDRIHAGDKSSVKRISRYYLVFFSMLVALCILAAPELIYIMGGKGYMRAAYAIPPVMAGYGCKFAYTFYVNMERFEKKTKYISLGTLAAAALNIVLNLIFIPQYGFVAAAYTTLAGFVMLVFMHYLMSKKLGIVDMYDNGFIFAVVGLLTVGGSLAGFLYQIHMLWRWVFIFILLMVSLAFGRSIYGRIRGRKK